MINNKIDKDINLLANTKLNENTSTDAIAYLVVENAKLQQENQQLKKQKDDVVEYIKSLRIFSARNNGKTLFAKILNEILRMLGEEE